MGKCILADSINLEYIFRVTVWPPLPRHKHLGMFLFFNIHLLLFKGNKVI